MMPDRRLVTSTVLAVLMVATAASAGLLKPQNYLADTRQKVSLEAIVPEAFEGWTMAQVSSGVVNPQQETLIRAIYAETLTRTYVSARGERVMLSIAYGKNQSDASQVHTPEVCYPGQGFQVKSIERGDLETPFGRIPVRRLETSFGTQRAEPVTYWTTLGDYAVTNGSEKKFKEIEYALQGYIADGLLFRVSSIDPDTRRGYNLQANFVNALLMALTPDQRRRLAGLAS